MSCKLLQVRDDGTHIPVMAVRVVPTNSDRVLRRAGFGVGSSYVILTNLNTLETQYDPMKWTCRRTMRTAHFTLEQAWNDYHDNEVIDIEYVLGEKPLPKEPE